MLLKSASLPFGELFLLLFRLLGQWQTARAWLEMAGVIPCGGWRDAVGIHHPRAALLLRGTVPPLLTVLLSLQGRHGHETLRGPPHTGPELLWPGKDVLPLVQEVLLLPGLRGGVPRAPPAHEPAWGFLPKRQRDSCHFRKATAFPVLCFSALLIRARLCS